MSFAFVAVHAALTIAVGAATGRKDWVIGLGAGLALVVFLVNAMAGVAEVFERFRDWSPWYWAAAGHPVVTPPGWFNVWLPLVLSALLVAAATWAFSRRDLAG